MGSPGRGNHDREGFAVFLRRLRFLVPAALVAAGAAAGAVQLFNDYRGASLPPLETLQKSFDRIRGAEDLRIEQVLGAAELENSERRLYCYFKDGSGNVYVDDSIVLVKLDTDLWIMKIRGASPENSPWGIITTP